MGIAIFFLLGLVPKIVPRYRKEKGRKIGIAIFGFVSKIFLISNVREKGKEIRIAMFFLGLVWPRGTRLSLRTVTATATHTKECKSREVTLMLLMPVM